MEKKGNFVLLNAFGLGKRPTAKEFFHRRPKRPRHANRSIG